MMAVQTEISCERICIAAIAQCPFRTRQPGNVRAPMLHQRTLSTSLGTVFDHGELCGLVLAQRSSA